MKNHFIFLLAFLLSFSPMSAWSASRLYFGNGGHLFSRDFLTDGTNIEEAGPFGGYDLRVFSNHDPRVEQEIQDHRDWNRAAHIYSISTLALLLGGVFVYYGGGGIGSDANHAYGLSMMLSSIVTSFLTHNAIAHSRHHLFRAINLMNGVPLADHDDHQLIPKKEFKISLLQASFSF